ncbi:hypothetical protein [Clostridium sp. C105KSO13]|uniref:hypothetical protein n=1 Tax=Clostridium sp. C105KSO13 TaxID=1776045 RepID=UPI000A91F0CD|nr:hypothetical protein [Clostridium sp. C105KSO13]
MSAPAQAAGITVLDEADRVKKTRILVTEERTNLEKELERIGVTFFGPPLIICF